MLPLCILLDGLQAPPNLNRNPPSPKGQELGQHILFDLRVTIKFIEIPVLALLNSSLHRTRSAKMEMVKLIQVFLFVLEL